MTRLPDTRWPKRLSGLAVVAVLWAVTLSSCADDAAVPIDPANPPVLGAEPPTDVTHIIPSTPQMEQLARQQCLDDPALEEGYVEAVDPATDRVLSEVTVDCVDARNGS